MKRIFNDNLISRIKLFLIEILNWKKKKRVKKNKWNL